ncbi:MAG: M1 family metallopeptidase [Anaerolineae bacterium]|nr:M1 family metallopeptidase [Anaerolineae bacterium]
MSRKNIRRLGWLLGVISGVALAYIGVSSIFKRPPDVITTTATPLIPVNTPEHEQAMRPEYQDDVIDFEKGTRYWMDLILEEDPVRVAGRERVQYVNASRDVLDAVVFRVYLNSLAGKKVLDVSDVSVGGRAVDAEWEMGSSVLRIPLMEPLGPGESIDVALQFAFEFTPDIEINYGRLANRDGVFVLSAFFPLLSVYERGSWWNALPDLQGDPAYSEIALFDVTLTAPSDLKVASTGVTLAAAELSDGTTKHTIVTGPVRDFSVAMSRDFELLSAKQNDITINVWSAPGNDEADQFALEKTLAALNIFDAEYGLYPLAELDVVEAPITAAGIEYPGLIYLAGNSWQDENDFFEVVIAHEVSHQWWYSMVGDNQVEQPWVDEALADYSVEVYYREAYGESAGASIREQYQSSLDQYLAGGGPQMPVGLPVSAYDGRQYGVFVYRSGALFYSHLHADYDPARLRDFLRAYYIQYRYRIAHTEDLHRMIGEFFGTEAEAFFDRWVYGS